MWPTDYINWALRARPLLDRRVYSQVGNLLPSRAPWPQVAQGLTRQAVRLAFDMANDRCRYPDYFTDEPQFGRWLLIVGFREVLRLFLRHPNVAPALLALPGDQRRLLGMVWIDQLPFVEVAAILGLTDQQARQMARAAFVALTQLL
jgi:DNA-directed RNA polymerase specialized sigma24 family protein